MTQYAIRPTTLMTNMSTIHSSVEAPRDDSMVFVTVPQHTHTHTFRVTPSLKSPPQQSIHHLSSASQDTCTHQKIPAVTFTWLAPVVFPSVTATNFQNLRGMEWENTTRALCSWVGIPVVPILLTKNHVGRRAADRAWDPLLALSCGLALYIISIQHTSHTTRSHTRQPPVGVRRFLRGVWGGGEGCSYVYTTNHSTLELRITIRSMNTYGLNPSKNMSSRQDLCTEPLWRSYYKATLALEDFIGSKRCPSGKGKFPSAAAGPASPPTRLPLCFFFS